MTRVVMLALVLCAGLAGAQSAITQCEWFIGADPGAGNGSAISIGSPDDTVALNFSVATGSLPVGLQSVNVRCRMNSGTWGVPTQQFFVIRPGSQVPRLVTSMDVAMDNGAPTNIDVTDAPQAAVNQIVATGSLPMGLHRFQVRTHDDLGRVGVYHDGFFIVQNNPAVVRLVTQFEYWFDNNSPSLLEVADAPSVNFAQILSTAGLGPGLHRFNLRARDDLGRIAQSTQAFLLISSPAQQGHTLAAAEYYVDTDPGVGSAIPFPLPQDGAWDEAAESVSTTLNNLGVGPHFFAVRTRDNLGRWSSAVGDTVLVNMSLVVQVVSGQLVLSWNAEGGAPYHVYRADLPTGPFIEIDSTNAQTYTDTGIINSSARKFYYVTQTLNGALNNPPALNPEAIKD